MFVQLYATADAAMLGTRQPLLHLIPAPCICHQYSPPFRSKKASLSPSAARSHRTPAQSTRRSSKAGICVNSVNSSWSVADMPSQKGKTFIVTGGSSGMGYHTARELAKHGAHVIIAARNLQKSEQAAASIKHQGIPGSVEALHLDLSSFRSISAFAEQIRARQAPVQCLINNGGVFLVPHNFTEEGFEVTVGINYFGPFLLTHLLLDKIQASKPARIVNMSSLFEQLGAVHWDDLEGHRARESGVFEYSNSKVMVLMMGRELNKRLQARGVESYISQPGLVKTPLNGPKLDHGKLTSWLVDISTKVYGQKPEVAAACLQRPATDPSLVGQGGSYFSPPWLGLLAIHVDHAGKREPSNALARDERAWARLYGQTLDIVNRKLAERDLPAIKAV